MQWEPTSTALVMFVAALVAVPLCGVAVLNRERRAAVPLAVVFATMAAWSFTEGVRLGFDTFAAQLRWFRATRVVAGFIGVGFLAFTLSYAGYEERLDRRWLLALLLEPVGYAALVWTNGAHHLVWTDARLVDSVTADLAVSFGPAYAVHLAFTYGLVAVGLLVVGHVFWRSSAIYRRQTVLLVVGAAIPFATNVALRTGVLPPTQTDLTPVTFVVSGTVMAVALFQFDLLNLTPVAREKLLARLGSGLVVVDEEGRIVHANDTATGALPAARVGADATDALDVEAVTDLDGEVVSDETASGDRFFDVHVSPLRDFRDSRVGWVLALQDVTERRRYEQRLEVTNRLLRHNLRNATAKLLAWAENVERTATDDAVSAEAGKIAAETEELAALATKARHIETSLAAEEGDETVVDLAAVLADVVGRVREDWPNATVTLDRTDGTRVPTTDRLLLEVAFTNLVENGIEHNDECAPRVEVTVGGEGDAAAVRIADDGPGLPEIERETLRRGTETPLRHSDGLGLWLSHWILEGEGGSIGFDETDGGTVVVARLPLAAPDGAATE